MDSPLKKEKSPEPRIHSSIEKRKKPTRGRSAVSRSEIFRGQLKEHLAAQKFIDTQDKISLAPSDILPKKRYVKQKLKRP